MIEVPKELSRVREVCQSISDVQVVALIVSVTSVLVAALPEHLKAFPIGFWLVVLAVSSFARDCYSTKEELLGFVERVNEQEAAG